MALDEARLLAFANVASALPLSDIVAAANDPTNLGKVAAVVEDTVSAMPAPLLAGIAADLAIQGFVDLVCASGGGTIARQSSRRAGRAPRRATLHRALILELAGPPLPKRSALSGRQTTAMRSM
jgi:hypothetical protein